jgi:hypothetical protein
MILALFFASISVASACIAATNDWMEFTLETERDGGQIKATFRDSDRAGSRESNWSAAFPPSQLVGLDLDGFRAVGTGPVRFAVVREPGRLDCSGQGGGSHARGSCAFTQDPAFVQYLHSRGIEAPTRGEAFGLMALGVRRDLIDALASARYPAPTIEELTSLTAVGVSGRYVSDLARLGYRPQRINSLVEFKALDVTPEFIGGFARIGYGNVDPGELVQMKALGITPDYVAGFQRIGYAHIPVDTLVQLKALNITPEFVRSIEPNPNGTLPSAGELMQRKIFGRRR